jgi:ribonucleoside-diphosphate reductase alpha chain
LRKFEFVRDITDMAQNILEKRYFHEGENKWENVASRSMDHVWYRKEFQDEKNDAYDMFNNRYFIPNSPTLVNSKSKNGGLIACFVVDFPDTIEGIYKTKLDFALIAKKGGGCGTSLTKIRPENAPVQGSTHGYAGGPIKFFDTICHDMEAMTQGGLTE